MSLASFRRILPFAIVAFLAFVGFSLPLPLFPELFLDPEYSILPKHYSISLKTIIMGAVVGGFPFGQFLGAPILGRLSDAWGRKKIIQLSLLGSTLGYIGTAAAVQMYSVPGIFLCLFLAGFCEGNNAIALSVIADLEEGASRTESFGWLNVFISVGFIVGPLLGGQLVHPELIGHIAFALPFYSAAALTLVGIVIIHFFARETRIVREEKIARTSLLQVWLKPSLKRFYLISFFLWVGLFFYWRYLPVFLEQTFDFRAAQQSYVLMYDSLIICLATPFVVGPLSRRVSPVKAAGWGGIFLALTLVIVVLPRTPIALIATIPPVAIGLAIVMTNSASMVSHAASSNMQGLAMGSFTALQMLAETLTTVGGGFLAGQWPPLPLFIGAFFLTCGSAIVFYERKRGNV